MSKRCISSEGGHKSLCEKCSLKRWAWCHETYVSAENTGLKCCKEIVCQQNECLFNQLSCTSVYCWFAGTHAGGYKHIPSRIPIKYKGTGNI